ncbi:hypothetical protein L596_029461 [Steinernema carpocapsae]|uniref:Non-specific serine/threonine protein kinase n=1 Tax=Steinernema carpocapsae TaxID=34508 RepID=A0A4U5LUP9_STECR|nr:hypothetical protein L596_029461 [Steinernema carpocapsae]
MIRVSFPRCYGDPNDSNRFHSFQVTERQVHNLATSRTNSFRPSEDPSQLTTSFLTPQDDLRARTRVPRPVRARQLGQGGYGKVFLVKKTCGCDTGKLYAMKVQKKIANPYKQHQVLQERLVMGQISHPFIVSLHYAFQTPAKLYMVMEFVRGGDMWSAMDRRGRFTDREVRFYAAELTLALEELHSRGYVYRDIKPDNVLLGVDGHIKLTDFGLVHKLRSPRDRAFSYTGTLPYVAPEVFGGRGYSFDVDWWSGILLFEMLTGYVPFDGQGDPEVEEQIKWGKLVFPPYVLRSTRLFLRALLTRNTEYRLGRQGARQVKEHPFFAGVDWEQLRSKAISPPYVPELRADPTSFFDSEFTGRVPFDSIVHPPPGMDQSNFAGFTFASSRISNRLQLQLQRRESMRIRSQRQRLPRIPTDC